jgi:hypothetical protein
MSGVHPFQRQVSDLTQVLVNGSSAGLGGIYNLAPGAVIAVTYTGTPAWTWNAPANQTLTEPPQTDNSSSSSYLAAPYYTTTAPDNWQSLPYGPHNAVGQALGVAVSN